MNLPDTFHRMMSGFFGFPHSGSFRDPFTHGGNPEDDLAGDIFDIFQRAPSEMFVFSELEDHFKDIFQSFGHIENYYPDTDNGPGFISPRDQMLKGNGPSGHAKDMDLDDRVTFGDLISTTEEQPMVSDKSLLKVPSHFHGVSKSVSVRKIQQPDGRIEEVQTVKDSHGNTTSTISRQIGNQRYTHTSITSSSGVKEEKEVLENLDEGSLKEFNSLWEKPSHPGILNAVPQIPLRGEDFQNKIDPNDSKSLWSAISKALGFEKDK